MPLRFPIPNASQVQLTRAEANNVAPAAEATIGQYLDQIDTQLAALPDDVRYDTQRELSLHLEALIAAHEELGDDRESATLAALRQFGEPKAIAARFIRAWSTPSSVESGASAISMGLAIFGLGVSVYLLSLLAGVPSGLNIYGALRHSLSTGWLWSGLFVIPAVAGALLGWRFPQRGAMGAFYALSILSIACLPLFAFGVSYGTGTRATGFTPSWYFGELSSALTPLFALWLPIGSIAAATTGALSKNRRFAI